MYRGKIFALVLSVRSLALKDDISGVLKFSKSVQKSYLNMQLCVV